jgi:hypothetical protein
MLAADYLLRKMKDGVPFVSIHRQNSQNLFRGKWPT